MKRYSKKIILDTIANGRQRLRRKGRTRKFFGSASDKLERRHGWGYLKRRALLTNS